MAPTNSRKPHAQSTSAPSNGNNGHSAGEPPASSSSVADHLAQVLQDLARGEQTASTLEANLSNLESKLDEILASFGVSAEDLDALDERDGPQKDTKKDAKKDNGNWKDGKDAIDGKDGAA